MADPITAGIVISTVAAVASAGMGAASQYGQAKAQSQAASYNAAELNQQATSARDVAAANMATSERRSAAVLGEQAAGFGQANIGTGRSVREQERQSAGNARLDALNIWYGGELEARQATSAATAQRYESNVYSSNATNALIGGGVKAGTAALMGGTDYYAYMKGDQLPFSTPTLGY